MDSNSSAVKHSKDLQHHEDALRNEQFVGECLKKNTHGKRCRGGDAYASAILRRTIRM